MSAAKGRAIATAVCAVLLAALFAAPAAQAAFDDPIYTFRPLPPLPPAEPIPPPDGDLEGPCGLAVDASGDFLVSDYYRNQIDLFDSDHGFLGLLIEIDPLDGPCGLSFGADLSLYVNDLHRNVVKYDPAFTAGTVIAGVGSGDGTHSTGVSADQSSGNVYVDSRNRIDVFGPTAAPLKQLGVGSLEDGYGIAFSEAPASYGKVYVADAGSDTVKVYDSNASDPEAPPVAEIDGSGTPLGHFVSLRDSAVAVDGTEGEVYVTDNLQPEYTERQESVVYVFDATGAYLGRLKYSLENSAPIGLAVDNTQNSTRGRVYVTSGNTERAAVYAYRPGSATTNAVPIPPIPPSGPGIFGSSSAKAATPAAIDPPAAAAAATPAAVASGAATPRRQATKSRHRAQRKHRHARKSAARISKERR